MKSRHIRTAGDWLALVIMILAALIILFPLIILFINAFKTQADYTQHGPLTLPKALTMSNITSFWKSSNFPVKLTNSIVISVCVAIIGVILSVLNSFALGIGRVKGNRVILVLILLANMAPQEALLYPLYVMFKAIGIYDTQLTVIIIFSIVQSAYGTYLLSSVYGTFPQAILEAGVMDGASKWQILWKIILPVSWPTISVLFVFFFVWTWNEYMIPMSLLISDSTQTVPLALAPLQGQYVVNATQLAGASLLSIIPTIIFYMFFQHQLTSGIVAGSVK
ncbi:carbohydrate ABC transporter permease [Bifidobacterium sp. ESL0775]|uniref:carbohydrate ABC transporter permease n=1 Tax=Bifidobacterium sp. ESL0775 TaxID=2983230 RepID=UPI0023F7EB87|nr:carbohydrate ABC transporter permease [Bifidobacterium sp. ESL0775]WEV68549.1 carbohydrate ABC transporter permease [Bifidobacterium sp. ESL0775]